MPHTIQFFSESEGPQKFEGADQLAAIKREQDRLMARATGFELEDPKIDFKPTSQNPEQSLSESLLNSNTGADPGFELESHPELPANFKNGMQPTNYDPDFIQQLNSELSNSEIANLDKTTARAEAEKRKNREALKLQQTAKLQLKAAPELKPAPKPSPRPRSTAPRPRPG